MGDHDERRIDTIGNPTFIFEHLLEGTTAATSIQGTFPLRTGLAEIHNNY